MTIFDHFWPYPTYPPFFEFSNSTNFDTRARARDRVLGAPLSFLDSEMTARANRKKNFFRKQKSLLSFAPNCLQRRTSFASEQTFIYCEARKDSLGLQTGRSLVFIYNIIKLVNHHAVFSVPRSVDCMVTAAMMLTTTNVAWVSPERTEMTLSSTPSRNAIGWTFSNLRRRAKRIVWGLKIFS